MKVYLVSEADADPHCGSHPVSVHATREGAERAAEDRAVEYGLRREDLHVDEMEVVGSRGGSGWRPAASQSAEERIQRFLPCPDHEPWVMPNGGVLATCRCRPKQETPDGR